MAAVDMGRDLAVFGGAPLFSRVRTTGQLANRDPERFFSLADDAFNRRWLSNQGPLVTELEERLAQLHGVSCCVAFANACFALILALRDQARPGATQVIVPALTFRGLPHLIRWAGLEPRYCDVDPVRHTMDPRSLAERIGPDTAAILAIDNANALCDIGAIEALAGAAGVPLIMDSVYGIGGFYGSGPVGARGAAAVFSLHATKLVNGFEGGYLTTNDADLAMRMRRQRTFGFGANGLPQELGMNAKLNELHAAMALSNLPHMAAIAEDNAQRFQHYRRAFDDLAWTAFADYSHGPGNYSLALLQVDAASPYTRDELIRILRAENALVRPYYSPPLHRTDPAGASEALPVSDLIASQFIQMPVGDMMSLHDIDRLRTLFAVLDSRSDEISARLRSLAH